MSTAHSNPAPTLSPIRIGSGYDVHAFAPQGQQLPLVLGGVNIPHTCGMVAHSDGDVIAHALTDALLGAAALPDIGQYFPNTDAANANRNSQEFLAAANAELHKAGYALLNASITVIAEAPKLAAHLPAMRAALADTLGAHPSAVGIQVTTHEGLGALGRGEGIAAHAVVLVQKN